MEFIEIFSLTTLIPGCRASRYDHITSLLRDELHNEVPGYLQELCMPVNMNTRRSTLPLTSDGLLIVPRKETKAGERAFSVAGPLAWNSLPVTVRQLSSLSSFKRHLKTYLFKASFHHDAVNHP